MSTGKTMGDDLFRVPKRPALLSWWFNRLARRARRESPEPAPLLDALLPILEYSYERLQAGGFSDAFLTAAIKADARISRAAEQLEPVGIYREDLCLLLQERMKDRLKMQRRKTALSGCTALVPQCSFTPDITREWKSAPLEQVHRGEQEQSSRRPQRRRSALPCS
jgi:hypothetical protein